MARGLGKQIGKAAFDFAPIGKRADFIEGCIKIARLRGNCAARVMDAAMLALVESEHPEQAMAYYDRQIAEVPNKWRQDVRRIAGGYEV